jgi:hypothetical protein
MESDFLRHKEIILCKEQSSKDRLLLDRIADTSQATKMYMEKKLAHFDFFLRSFTQ